MLLLPLLLFFPSLLKLMCAMQNSALYRYPTGTVSFGNFERDPFYYLWVEKLSSSMVKDQLDCTFLCVREPNCYSFNMAAYPDSKGVCLCELLATDKYRETEKFHANATFHHYRARVRHLYSYLAVSRFQFFGYRINVFSWDDCFLLSLHVKAFPARTVVSVFLNMKRTPIIVIVSLDSMELTVNVKVWD